ncbi:MAG: hypothetical protein ACW99L_18775 [Promethearchaeota archaeon]|jgi:hypothetical protein
MSFVHKKYKKTPIIVLAFIVLGSPILTSKNQNIPRNSHELSSSKNFSYNLDRVQFNIESSVNWGKLVQKADQNNNGIHDEFDIKLKSSTGILESEKAFSLYNKTLKVDRSRIIPLLFNFLKVILDQFPYFLKTLVV